MDMDTRAIVSENQKTIEEVLDLFTKNGLSSIEGEVVMAWIIGLSLGNRMVSATSRHVMGTIATAWIYAAGEGV